MDAADADAAPDAALAAGLDAGLLGTPPAPGRAARPLGRPRGRPAEATRERILDAAERLFAERGYDGASIRDVAAAAGVQLHAVGYHFGPKDALFDSVVARRAAVMTAMRREALAAALAAAGDGAIPLERLIGDYLGPFIHAASHGDPGWRTYAALMGRLANSVQGAEVIARHYDATARAYIAQFARALPGVPEAAVIDGFLALVAAMLAACAATGRPARLALRPTPPRLPLDSLETLVRFHAAGFRALRPRDP